MSEEIKQLIEEEASKYNVVSSIIDNKKSFKAGANFILSKWQEANRWRKVEEELPPLGEPVWLKDENAQRNYSKYDSGVRREDNTQDGWYWDNAKSTKNYTHWKHIE